MSDDLRVGFSFPRLPPPGGARTINPISAVRALTWKQQAIFWSGWLVRRTKKVFRVCADKFSSLKAWFADCASIY